MVICKVDGCDNIVEAKGFCQKHYKRYKNGQDPFKRSKKDKNKYKIIDDYMRIELYSDDKVANYGYIDLDKLSIVEDILDEFVISQSNSRGKNSYLSYTVNSTTKALVYDLFGKLEKGYIYSYKNGNGLDVRAKNIEVISHKEHSRRLSVNRAKYGVGGISRNKNSGSWIVRISTDEGPKYLGSYGSFEEAKDVRIKAEIKYWGKQYSK